MKLSQNFVKRKLYKALPRSMRARLFSHLLPCIEPNLDNFYFRAAITPKDYLSAFNLVYEVFVNAGFTSHSRTPFRLAPQHCHEDSRVFIGLNKTGKTEKLVYSISIFPDSERGLPMDDVFSDELNWLRSKNRFIAEVGHLAADPSYKMDTMNIPMLGNKILYQYASEHLQVDDLVIATHPKYKWFYEELLLFEKIGEIDNYSYANNNPAVAMRLDLRKAPEAYEKYYRNVRNGNNLYHFFITKKSESIHLSDEDTSIERSLLKNIENFYDFEIVTDSF